MSQILCVDVGSTFTKGVLVDTTTGALVARAETPTTVQTDVLDGYRTLRQLIAAQPITTDGDPRVVDEVLVSSSAGGGLRLAVVGYERRVTAEAGHRVGLSAGAKVVHVAAGELSGLDVRELRAARPDVVLLVGGTDGGNADVLLHNATRLARMRVKTPIVVAGNVEVRDQVAEVLASTGRRYVVTDNVLPRIGVIEPAGARRAIREVFLEHVIGGKGLSRGRTFAHLVRAATPDAVLAGVEVLAARHSGDVLVVDVGGATTDVYSVIEPQGEDATLRRHVVATMWAMRTVEGDLGMRWNAPTVVEAAGAEGLPVTPELEAYAERVGEATGHLPQDPGEHEHDATLARLAAVIAVRRHARPDRPTGDVRLVLGSGGVLRHGDLLSGGVRAGGRSVAADVLGAVTSDWAGGWRVPDRARVAVDRDYLLCAVGLLAEVDREAAGRVADRLLWHP
ncbi:glutamate mutase L [Arsenicicoccus dermatophilus]|uniref:glutamate mutase L n=1 Tax=Arsenicicoccus dermatophilus TaxID=1076331 RepID=UPI001F4C7724|nr:glutamate mutase L [Arsenicicoccus dermatophilus]MCH8612154.1 glutamate mutase L [Arsenicicoccus dermatophilus]